MRWLSCRNIFLRNKNKRERFREEIFVGGFRPYFSALRARGRAARMAGARRETNKPKNKNKNK